jgi:Bacterial archaeo-eukaryotic release factor family 2
METSEGFPPGAVDVSDLADIVKDAGPFLTLYLHTESKVENAAQRSLTRWKTLRGDLAHGDVPEALLDDVEALVPEAHLRGEALAVVATSDGIRHVEYGPSDGPNDVGVWTPLPTLVPLLRYRQSHPPMVVVLADRVGADLVTIRHGASDVEETVEGEDDPITKVAPGGWSQRRYQERAENTWEANATLVAEEVSSVVRRVDAEVVVVAGDVRAVGLLRQELPPDVVSLVREVSGERPSGGSGETIPDEAWRVRDEVVRAQTDALLSRLAEEVGQHDVGAEGAARTATAAVAAQVAVLLLAPSRSADRTLWCGPQPTQLATDRGELSRLGVEPFEAPAADALIRAAIATDAGVRIVEPSEPDGENHDESRQKRMPADGIGALLRWAAP